MRIHYTSRDIILLYVTGAVARMRGAAPSVPAAVREIVTGNRPIRDCLRMGLINYTALAARIRPDVEVRLGGHPVPLNTIVVAIKRHADSTRGAEAEAPGGPVLKDARIALTDGVVEVRVEGGGARGRRSVADLLERFSGVAEDFDLFGLPGSFRLLTEDLEGARRAVRSIPHGQGTLGAAGLVRLRITVPAERRTEAGPHVVELLHGSGVEFVDAYFSRDDMVITFEREHAARAYDALRSAAAGR